jgi:hypothetical protein
MASDRRRGTDSSFLDANYEIITLESAIGSAQRTAERCPRTRAPRTVAPSATDRRVGDMWAGRRRRWPGYRSACREPVVIMSRWTTILRRPWEAA